MPSQYQTKKNTVHTAVRARKYGIINAMTVPMDIVQAVIARIEEISP